MLAGGGARQTRRAAGRLLVVALVLAGCDGLDGGAPDASGEEVLPPADAALDGGASDASGEEVLPPADAAPDATPEAAACTRAADCDDGLWCSGPERCEPGAAGADGRGCVAGAPPCPPDGHDCTREPGPACDEAADRCPPAALDHAACGAARYCHPLEGCLPGIPCPPGGGPCPDGDDNPCTVEACDETRRPVPLCVAALAAEGTACTRDGGTGSCQRGACCTGCWDGAACRPGDALAACGAGGGACASCDDGNPCTDEACAAGACTSAADDTNACPGGTCHVGACCTGCWDGAACRSGVEACNGSDDDCDGEVDEGCACAGGWSPEGPIPTLADLRDVWLAPDGQAFAVGARGTILRHDGAVWSTMTSGTSADLHGIWGASATDLFVVGASGTILHYDGGAWWPMASGASSTLADIWGASPTDVFAVGEERTVLHYDGVSWSAMTIPDVPDESPLAFTAVWGTSGRNVFAAANSRTLPRTGPHEPTWTTGRRRVLRYDGASWTVSARSSWGTLRGLWGSGPDDVLVVGNDGSHALVNRFDGTSWGAGVLPGEVHVPTTAVCGTSATDVHVVGLGGTTLHFDGSAWTEGARAPGGADLAAVACGSPSRALAVGAGAAVLWYDGRTWAEEGFGGTRFRAVWGAGPADLLAAGDHGSVFRGDGRSWRRMETGTRADLGDVWAASAADVWVAGPGALLHHDGASWQTMPTGLGEVGGLWVRSSTDAYVTDSRGLDRRVFHYDGVGWPRPDAGTEASLSGRSWTSTPHGLFVVGADGSIRHHDGLRVSSIPRPPGDWHWVGVWGTSPADVFAATYRFDTRSGSLLRYDGTEWSTLAALDEMCGALWGTPSGDLFLACDRRGLLRWSAGMLSSLGCRVDVESRPLWGVWAASERDVYGVRRYRVSLTGGLVHYDGSDCEELPLDRVTSVWGASASDVYALQDGGTVFRFDGRAWTEMPARLPMGIDPSGQGVVWSRLSGTSATNLFAAGSGGAVARYDGRTWSLLSPYAPDHNWGDALASPSGAGPGLIWGSSRDDVYLHGTLALLRYDGSTWSVVASGPGEPPWGHPAGIWGASATDLFVGRFWASGAGRQFVHHWDGRAWTSTELGTSGPLRALWGASPRDVFAVGDLSTIVHFDGIGWREMVRARLGSGLAGVGGSAGDNVFAVGGTGTILRYDGASWTALASGTAADLEDVWARSANDVFVVGKGGILHRCGAGW